jgi:hypothetical protein
MDDAVHRLSPIDALVAFLRAMANELRPITAKATDCPGLSVPDLSNVVLFRRPRR